MVNIIDIPNIKIISMVNIFGPSRNSLKKTERMVKSKSFF